MKVSKKISPILLSLIIFLSLSLLTGYAAENTITIKLGHHHNVNGEFDIFAKKFKEIAEEKSEGRLKIEIYPGGQLGQEGEAAEGILIGTLDMSIISEPMFSEIAKGFGIGNMPYLYKNREALIKAVTDSPVGKELERRLVEKGARILGWRCATPRHMIFTKKEVKSLEDLKGLKMRSPEDRLYINMFKTLECQPTPITWGEAYLALQTGVVDGMETPLNTGVDMNFHEVTKFVFLDYHMLGTNLLLINEGFFQKLPSELKEVIIEAGKAAEIYTNSIAEQTEQRAIEIMIKQGLVFNEINEEDLAKVKSLFSRMHMEWGKEHNATELIEKIYEINKDI